MRRLQNSYNNLYKEQSEWNSNLQWQDLLYVYVHQDFTVSGETHRPVEQTSKFRNMSPQMYSIVEKGSKVFQLMGLQGLNVLQERQKQKNP